MASGGSHRLHPKRTLLKIRPDGLIRRSVGAMGASALAAGLAGTAELFWEYACGWSAAGASVSGERSVQAETPDCCSDCAGACG